MARFKFGLESVLEQRKREERVLQGELATCLQAQIEIEAEIARIEQELQTEQGGIRQSLVGALDVQRLLSYRRYLAARSVDVGRLGQKLSEAKLGVEAARRKLIEASRRRKSLESLREKQEQGFIAEVERREAIDADEVATQMAFAQLQSNPGTPTAA